MRFSPYSLSLFAAAVLALGLARFGRTRARSVPGSAAFEIFMVAVAVWSFAYGFELASASLDAKLFWVDVEYLGVVTVPAAWLVFALEHSGRGRFVTRRILLLLCVEPLLVVALAWTNPTHGLFYSGARLLTEGPVTASPTTTSPCSGLTPPTRIC